jgi:hypothetical protein
MLVGGKATGARSVSLSRGLQDLLSISQGGPQGMSQLRRHLITPLALAASLGLTASAAAATVHLYGATLLHTRGDPKVLYRATGLRPANRYALRLVRPTTGSQPRCVAYLSGPQHASGTERFYGSVPSAMYCGAAPGKAQPIRAGSYEVEVCVPATTFGPCRADASVVRQRVRVVR